MDLVIWNANKTIWVLMLLVSGCLSGCSSSIQSQNGTSEAPDKVRERVVAAGTLHTIGDEKGNSFQAVVVDIERADLNLYLLDDDKRPIGSFKRLNEIVTEKGMSLVFAMNAGIFGKDHLPLGLHVEGKRELRALDMDAAESGPAGNFYLKPNGVFAVRNGEAFIDETLHFSETVGNARDFPIATQSGPLLVTNGQINTQFQSDSQNKTVRNSVGVIDSRTVVFIISTTPVNFYDFATVFKDRFGCQNALYLDGAISRMYIPEINDKIDDSRFAGMFAVTPKKEPG